LSGAQLHTVNVAEGAVGAGGAGCGDTVIPELTVDGQVEFVANYRIKVVGDGW